MRKSQFSMSLSLHGFSVTGSLDDSEPIMRIVLFLGWSAFILWLLLEAMRIYQF